MIEILEIVSDEVWKVENMHSESMPVIEREYHTPPVSQTRIAILVKLNNTPNLPTFSGQEPVPSTEGLIDQQLFQVKGTLATHMEEAVRLAVRGAACELLKFTGYGEELDVIIRHIKEHLDRALLKQNSRKNSS